MKLMLFNTQVPYVPPILGQLLNLYLFMYSKEKKIDKKQQPECINEYRSRFLSTGPGSRVQVLY